MNIIEQMKYLCSVTIPCTRTFLKHVVKWFSCFLKSMKYWYSNCLAFIFISIERTSKLSELVHSLIIWLFLRFISFSSSIVMSPEMIFLQVTSNWVRAQAQITCQSAGSFRQTPEGLKMVSCTHLYKRASKHTIKFYKSRPQFPFQQINQWYFTSFLKVWVPFFQRVAKNPCNLNWFRGLNSFKQRMQWSLRKIKLYRSHDK